MNGAIIEFTRSSGKTYPATWDASVQPIASFVEENRGLTFKHPVPVQFLASTAFDKSLTADQADSPFHDPIAEARMRALGLIGPTTNLSADATKLTTTGVLAYYSSRDQRIVIRGSALDVSTRVTVAHELTHVLQDQYFGVNSLYSNVPKGAEDAVTSLVEGDAVVIENLFVHSLSQSDQDAYAKTQQSGFDQFKKDIAAVTPVLDVAFGAPYELGRALVQALRKAGGTSRLDEAFRNPPQSEAAVMRASRFLAGDVPAVVNAPAPGAAEKSVGSPEVLGALTLYLMLVQRLDPRVALAAADEWSGDETRVVKKADGTVCVRAAIVGDNAAHTADIEHALENWAASGPSGAARASAGNGQATFFACDAGTKTLVPSDHPEILRLPMNRALIATDLLDSMSLKAADCVAGHAVQSLTYAQLDDPTDPYYQSSAFQSVLAGWTSACGAPQ